MSSINSKPGSEPWYQTQLDSVCMICTKHLEQDSKFSTLDQKSKMAQQQEIQAVVQNTFARCADSMGGYQSSAYAEELLSRVAGFLNPKHPTGSADKEDKSATQHRDMVMRAAREVLQNIQHPKQTYKEWIYEKVSEAVDAFCGYIGMASSKEQVEKALLRLARELQALQQGGCEELDESKRRERQEAFQQATSNHLYYFVTNGQASTQAVLLCLANLAQSENIQSLDPALMKEIASLEKVFHYTYAQKNNLAPNSAKEHQQLSAHLKTIAQKFPTESAFSKFCHSLSSWFSSHPSTPPKPPEGTLETSATPEGTLETSVTPVKTSENNRGTHSRTRIQL